MKFKLVLSEGRFDRDLTNVLCSKFKDDLQARPGKSLETVNGRERNISKALVENITNLIKDTAEAHDYQVSARFVYFCRCLIVPDIIKLFSLL